MTARTGQSGDDGFRVSATLEEGRLSVELSGEFDLGSAQHWDDVVPPLADAKALTIEIDFAAVEFMDSSGLGQLVRLRHRAQDSNSTIHLHNVPENVRRVLDYAGVSALFDVSPA